MRAAATRKKLGRLEKPQTMASTPLWAYGDSARGVMKKRASLVSTQPSCPWDMPQDPWGKLSLADQRHVLDPDWPP